MILYLDVWVVSEVSNDWSTGCSVCPNTRPLTGKPTAFFFFTGHQTKLDKTDISAYLTTTDSLL